TTSTSTTEEPLIPIFTCYFSMTSCFEGSPVLITNGNEFTPVDISEEPLAPLSDVTSISELKNNNETCKLPYRPSRYNSTTAATSEIWFCYKNQCLTESQQLVNCTSGNYGLISIEPWESNKTLIQSISQGVMRRNSVGEQCLRYYYYFTVYNQFNWGQRISVSIRPKNEITNEIEIDQLSIVDMVENRWHPRNITFTSAFSNYTLIFYFEVANINRTDHAALNKTIYFALDNIDLYSRNCQNVIEPPTSPITTSPIASQSSTMTTTTKDTYELTASPSSKQQILS
ncbi:unnamed protein product, partial [Rotaria sp. Silwood2]